MLYLLWLLVLCFAVRGQEVNHWTHSDLGNDTVVEQDERFSSIFDVTLFKNIQCTGILEQQGTCYSRAECSLVKGIASGSCARNWGVCCVIHKSCGSSTKFNGTYFNNPGFPGLYKDGDSTLCTVTVHKNNPNICQLRVDFLDFTLSQPNLDGHCNSDYLEATGGAYPVPTICGVNTDQHVYMEFQEGNIPIQLSIKIDPRVPTTRRWNIKLTQIECTSRERAPPGLLMYFRELEGRVKSFNYDPASRDLGTRELANLNYGVGIRVAPGYCSIEWKQDAADPFSFTVSDDTGGNVAGNPLTALQGENCTTDFVVIPNPYQRAGSLLYDRFCGNALLTMRTSSKPFVLTVVTDGDEPVTSDFENRGFSLIYRQIHCH